MQKNLPLLAEQLEYGNKYTFRFNLTTRYTLVYLGKDDDGKLLFYNATLNTYCKPMNYNRFTFLVRFKLEKFEPTKITFENFLNSACNDLPEPPVELWEDEEPPKERHEIEDTTFEDCQRAIQRFNELFGDFFENYGNTGVEND